MCNRTKIEVVDKFITITTKEFTYPNKNIHIFLKQIEKYSDITTEKYTILG